MPPSADATRRTRRRGPWFYGCLTSVVASLVAGCASQPPPAPPPRAVAEAERVARQAAKLQAEENWAGAAPWWQRAGQQFQLLHREADVAVAEHNEGVSRRALGQDEEARRLLEDAARLNERLGLGLSWWHNQVALLQLENGGGHADQAEARLARLASRTGELAGQAGLQGQWAHEEARLRLAQGRLPEARRANEEALARFEAITDVVGAAATRLTRARILTAQGGTGEAEPAWREALRAFEVLGNPRGIALALAGLGGVLADQPARRTEAIACLQRAAGNLRTLRLGAEAAAAEARLAQLSARPGP